MRFMSITLAALACMFLLTACNGEKRPAGIPQQFPTTVVVKQEGKPLDKATVTFYAVEENSPNAAWAIVGTTDATGSAQMAVNGKYKGSPAGKFKVTIIKTETEKPVEIPPGPDPAVDPKGYGEWRIKYKVDQDVPPLKSWTFVDSKYTRVETTPLEVEVKPEPNTIDIDAGKAMKVEEKFAPRP